MPGKIQVSVLGFVDLASPLPPYPLSLKVAMGRKEFQSMGDVELSFPVVSLRENMMMTVHDAEGKELLKTEFRTIILLESGQWDNLFPLNDGGSIHMKLQFSLSEEDHKRIREKRDSVLKKKCTEDRKTKLRRSFSDEYGNASDSSLLQVSEQNSERSLEKDARHFTQSIEVSQLSLEAALHSQSDCSRFLVLGTFTEPSSSSGAELDKYKSRLPESKDMPVTNLNSKGAGRRFGQQKSYLKSLAVRRDTSSLKDFQTMSKSFSVDMLSEISSQGNSKLVESFFRKNKEIKNFYKATYHKTFGNKIQPLDLKNEEKFHGLDINIPDIETAQKFSSYTDPSYAIASSSSMEIDNVRKLMGFGKPSNLTGFAGTSRETTGTASVDVLEDKKASFTMPILWKSEDVVKVNPNIILKEDHISDSNAPSSPNGEKLAEYITDKEKHDKRNSTGDEHATSVERVTNAKIGAVEVKENKNEEHRFVEKSPSSKKTLEELGKIENPYSISTQQLESSVISMASESEENVFEGHSIERDVAGSSFGKEGALWYAYSSVCPIGSLGIWRPHLCITTGNKQLRDFVESCSASEGANSIGSSSISKANSKKEEGDAYIKRKENKVLCSSRKSDNENSSGNLKLSGGLIEQGVRIIFIIVACGLLLNHR